MAFRTENENRGLNVPLVIPCLQKQLSSEPISSSAISESASHVYLLICYAINSCQRGFTHIGADARNHYGAVRNPRALHRFRSLLSQIPKRWVSVLDRLAFPDVERVPS